MDPMTRFYGFILYVTVKKNCATAALNSCDRPWPEPPPLERLTATLFGYCMAPPTLIIFWTYMVHASVVLHFEKKNLIFPNL